MTKRLVIFGTGDTAALAHYFFSKEGEYQVAAFTVDDEFISEASFSGLPVVPFSEISKHFNASDTDVFVALGYSKLNSLRRSKFLEAKALGYTLASYISPDATVLTEHRFGENCFIFENNTIQPFVSIGHNVTLWSGNHIGHHSVIRDHCFIASHAVISGRVDIGEQCFIGVNATLRDHIKVGARCVIGAGALLLRDAEPEGIYVGRATERSRVPSSRLQRI